MKRKILSVLLTVCMVLTMVPTVWASEGPVAEVLNRQGEVSGTFNDLQEAFDYCYEAEDCGSEGTVRFLRDVELEIKQGVWTGDEGTDDEYSIPTPFFYCINAEYISTIDLGGHRLTAKFPAQIDIQEPEAFAAYLVAAGGTLWTPIFCSEIEVIRNGTIRLEGERPALPDLGEDIDTESLPALVSGIFGMGGAASIQNIKIERGETTAMDAGIILSQNNPDNNMAYELVDCHIALGDGIPPVLDINADVAYSKCKYYLASGTYSGIPEGDPKYIIIPETSTRTEHEDGTISLVDHAVATIGYVRYGSLADALASAGSYDDIVLQQDIEIDGFTVPQKNHLILDLNGHTLDCKNGTITVPQGLSISISDHSKAGGGSVENASVQNNGYLTLYAPLDNTQNDGASIINSSGATLSIQGGAIKAAPGKTAVENAGTVSIGYIDPGLIEGDIKNTGPASKIDFRRGTLIGSLDNEAGGTIEIKDGTFSESVAEYVDPSKKPFELNDNGTYTYHETKEEAVAAATQKEAAIITNLIEKVDGTTYHNVTLDYANGDPKEVTEVAAGQTFTLPAQAPVRTGYTFQHWSDGTSTYAPGASIPVGGAVTLTAQWEQKDPAPDPDPDPNPEPEPDPEPSYRGDDDDEPTYSVTVPGKIKHGDVSVRPKNAEKGDTVTITVKPDAGYEVDEVTVTDRKGNELKVKDKGDGKYTFTMPASKVEIDVTFVKEQATPAVAFDDVSADAWYHDAAGYVAEKGLMSGTGDGMFSPGRDTSRAMIWVTLARMDGRDVSVQQGNWYEKAQSWAMARGLTDGSAPNGSVTREQLALMLYNYAELKGYDTDSDGVLQNYRDAASVSPWAVEALDWAVSHGLITGAGEGLLAPQATATRAQVAVILMNFCEDVAE